MTPAQAGCFLMGLRMKGETPLEMAHAVGIALGRANRVEGLEGDCIDVVGTGGDGRNSFNCSTATALTLAGMGYRVVKHGNRAVSSSCGSADALEGLGFPLDVAPEDVRRLLDERNFAFLFAPNFHPSFRNVGPIRRELGIRTLFNLLGPLVNPCRPAYQLLGVSQLSLMRLYTYVFCKAGIEFAVVNSLDNYDEISLTDEFKVMTRRDERIYRPQELGFDTTSPTDLQGGRSREDASRIFDDVLTNRATPAQKHCVLVNAAFAIQLMEPDKEIGECIDIARRSLESGQALKTLKKFIEINR